MHQGDDTDFYLRKGFRVIAIEANPKLVASGSERFANQIESGQLIIVPRAIVDDDSTEVRFFVNQKKHDWGTVHENWNRSMNSDYTEICVPAIRLEKLIEEHGIPYYMKIDIEGADAYCLHSLLAIGKAPKHVSVELMTPNNLKGSQVNSLEILCLLYAIGYRSFRVSDQSRLKHVRCPNPAREGNYVDQQFDGFSSGPFGDELATTSFSIDEVSHAYLDYFYQRRKPLLSTLLGQGKSPFHQKGWFDVHASLPAMSTQNI